MKYRIFKHTFELSDLYPNKVLKLELRDVRFVKWLDAKPNPTSAHKIDVWFVVEAELDGYVCRRGRLLVQGTGWLLEPYCALSHIATVRTPDDFVFDAGIRLIGISLGRVAAEAGVGVLQLIFGWAGIDLNGAGQIRAGHGASRRAQTEGGEQQAEWQMVFIHQ